MSDSNKAFEDAKDMSDAFESAKDYAEPAKPSRQTGHAEGGDKQYFDHSGRDMGAFAAGAGAALDMAPLGRKMTAAGQASMEGGKFSDNYDRDLEQQDKNFDVTEHAHPLAATVGGGLSIAAQALTGGIYATGRAGAETLGKTVLGNAAEAGIQGFAQGYGNGRGDVGHNLWEGTKAGAIAAALGVAPSMGGYLASKLGQKAEGVVGKYATSKAEEAIANAEKANAAEAAPGLKAQAAAEKKASGQAERAQNAGTKADAKPLTADTKVTPGTKPNGSPQAAEVKTGVPEDTAAVSGDIDATSVRQGRQGAYRKNAVDLAEHQQAAGQQRRSMLPPDATPDEREAAELLANHNRKIDPDRLQSTPRYQNSGPATEVASRKDILGRSAPESVKEAGTTVDPIDVSTGKGPEAYAEELPTLGDAKTEVHYEPWDYGHMKELKQDSPSPYMAPQDIGNGGLLPKLFNGDLDKGVNFKALSREKDTVAGRGQATEPPAASPPAPPPDAYKIDLQDALKHPANAPQPFHDRAESAVVGAMHGHSAPGAAIGGARGWIKTGGTAERYAQAKRIEELLHNGNAKVRAYGWVLRRAAQKAEGDAGGAITGSDERSP